MWLWLVFAVVAAFSAGLTSIFTKVGLKGVDTDVATFLRTSIVVVFALIMALSLRGFQNIGDLTLTEWGFIVGSGVATGLSWLTLYKALQLGKVNRVAPIGRLSTVVTMAFAIIIFQENFWWLTFVSMALMLAGVMLMLVKRKKATQNVELSTNNEQRTTTNEMKDLTNEEQETGSNKIAGDIAIAVPQAEKTENGMPLTPTIEISENQHNPDNNLPHSSAAVSDSQPPTTNHQSLITKNMWFVYAVLSLIFASATALLARAGLGDERIDPQLWTFLRTVVVLFMAFFIMLGKRKTKRIKEFTKKNYLFLILSATMTGISWLAFYNAISIGNLSVIVPIDKLSIVVTIAFSFFFLKEKLSIHALIGLIILVTGTMLLLVPF